MSDQTPVTDDDRRHLREDAQDTLNQPLSPRAAMRLAEYVLDTVPAPPKSLADELREYAKDYATVSRRSMLRILADRVEAVVQERDKAQQDAVDAWEHAAQTDGDHVRAMGLWEQDYARVSNECDEARAEVERLSRQVADQMTAIHTANAEVQRLTTELARKEASRQHYIRHAQTSSDDRALLRDEVKCLKDEVAAFNDAAKASAEEAERLTSGRTSKESLPVASALSDPADVPRDEVWEIEINSVRAVALRNGYFPELPWVDVYTRTAWPESAVTLVARLVPDVRRVIDRPEEMDALPVGSVVLDLSSHAWEKYPDDEWYSTELDDGFSSRRLIRIGSVTVIHEPEVTA